MSDRSLQAPVRLRCEYLENPLGIDAGGFGPPRLCWQVRDARRGAKQTAYRILVASSPDALKDSAADVWDSGKVASGVTTHIEYAGPALGSRQCCWWTVRTWDVDDEASPWAEPAYFEMGLLDAGDWQAKWIGASREGDEVHCLPAAYLRKAFAIDKPIVKARLYASARGIYVMHINGQRIGDDYFRPGWTEYEKHIPYQTYDVTDFIEEGEENAVGGILGDGWYRGHLMWRPERDCYGAETRLLAQLEITFKDGSTQTIATDGSWQVTNDGPIRQGDYYMGEIYDARKQMPGWSEAGFDDSAWQTAECDERDEVALTAAQCEPVRATQELTPLNRTEPEPGRYIFDLGQNMVGVARLQVKGKAGDTVTLRFAEMLQDDGTLYTEALRKAKSTDTYTLGGDAAGESYQPIFTFHGFRYVEITGWPGSEPPALDAVTGVVLHTDAPLTSRFETSHALVNQLQSNIVWGQRGNYLEVPTDCPQRNERLGWTGDAQVFIRTGTFNMDVGAFFTKWIRDLENAQRPSGAFTHVAPDILRAHDKGSPAWADAGVICPWTIYQAYGDVRILQRHYHAMTRWINCQRDSSTNLIRREFGYGDWLHLDDMTPKALIGTAYFAHTAHLVSRVAQLIGKPEEAVHWAQLAKDVRAAFNREFVTPAGRIAGNSQTAYLLALAFDLLPESKVEEASRRLVKCIEQREDHLSTGFVGCPLLLPVLTRIGRVDLACQLLRTETYPSWLYPIHQGATTMWERWNSYTKDKGFGPVGMNSFNHYAYGAVGEWMYANITGIDIDPDEPGFKHIIIHPRPGGGFDHAHASYDSIHGCIATSWKIDGDAMTLDITIPANCTATAHLPVASPEQAGEAGKPLHEAAGISSVTVAGDHVTCDLVAGRYQFVLQHPTLVPTNIPK